MARFFQSLFTRHIGNLLGFFACAGLLASAYYLQLVKGVEPCPLCVMQRVAVFATGIAFLVAALHNPGLIAVLSLTGAGVAGRHVWLQYMPVEKRPACGPGLEYLLGTFGPLEGLRRILRGSGECGVVDFTLLGLSLPHWTLLAFVVFAAGAAALAFRD